MEISRIAILSLNVQLFFLKKLACINTCVVTSVSIRSNFKPDFIFFLCTQNTVVTFVPVVNDFKSTPTFVY